VWANLPTAVRVRVKIKSSKRFLTVVLKYYIKFKKILRAFI
jgi:hypothetical protein